MKPYCTQNDGDCDTCSLVNYGRDCMNNPCGHTEKECEEMHNDILAEYAERAERDIEDERGGEK